MILTNPPITGYVADYLAPTDTEPELVVVIAKDDHRLTAPRTMLTLLW